MKCVSIQPFAQLLHTLSLQVLDAIPTTDHVYRRCLHKLQAICGHHMTLPTSHNISGDLTRVGEHPISVEGGSADVWEGIHDGRKVCIKCPRVSEMDLQAITQVRVQRYQHSFSPPLKDTCEFYSRFSKKPLYGRG